MNYRELVKMVAEKRYASSSPGVLAEETWSAIDAVGALEWMYFGILRDLTTGDFYFEDDFPAEIPLGHEVDGLVWFANKYSSGCVLHYEIEFIDPDGYSRGKYTGGEYFSPGEEIQRGTNEVIIDKAGTWKVHAILKD